MCGFGTLLLQEHLFLFLAILLISMTVIVLVSAVGYSFSCFFFFLGICSRQACCLQWYVG